mmetsp:Transcript_26320/g.42634  ORF Transcript_26320/g.42634 Transcript_26320/m.42634 type:complete len:398 (-) Transcript_26320:170-1363(-)
MGCNSLVVLAAMVVLVSDKVAVCAAAVCFVGVLTYVHITNDVEESFSSQLVDTDPAAYSFIAANSSSEIFASQIDDPWKLALSKLLEQLPRENETDAPVHKHIGTNSTWEKYLLVTMHGKPHNTQSNNVRVYKYDIDESHRHHWKLSGLALQDKSIEKLGIQNLRGMKAVGGALFIASAHSTKSKIVLTDKCSLKRRYARTFAVDGLNHPYGVTFRHGKVYATNQNTDVVVRFKIDDGLEPEAETFAKVRNPRGLTFDRFGRLWVCSTKDGVSILDGETGKELHRIDVKHPVGIASDPHTGMIYVGSYHKKKPSKIIAISPVDFEQKLILQVPKPYRMQHPAGLVISNDRLFVVAQEERMLYAWNLLDGSFKGAVLKNLPKRPEQVAILRCFKRDKK